MNLADKYHDERGRPLAPPVPETSQMSRGALEAWQRATLARATARQEARADTKELGPLHAQPSTEKAKRRAILSTSLGAPPAPVTAAPAGAQPDDPDEIRAAINAAFDLPPPVPVPAGEPEQPTAEPTAPVYPPPAPDPTAETERRMANLKAAEERIAARAAKRRASSLKSAATVRARRAQREQDAEVDKMMAKSLDRIGERVLREQAIADDDAAQAEADPGIPTYRSILTTARDAGPDAEAELYRLAHLARATRKPADWPAALRSALATSLTSFISSRKTPKPKGPQK